MNSPHLSVNAADVLIGGDVIRVVLSGVPVLNASSPAEALEILRREHDDFRRFVIQSPRGHQAINGCLLLPAFSPEAVRTIVVAPQLGYVPIAGTPLMAAAAALAELGELVLKEPLTEVVFDTAKGRSVIEVRVEGGRCRSTSWHTRRPSMIVRDEPIVLGTGQTVPVSVISPGIPYAVVRAGDLDVGFDDTVSLGAAGAKLASALGDQLSVETTGLSGEASDYHVMVVGNMSTSGECARVEVACISPDGWVWATPAGTGAISVAAYLDVSGELHGGEWLETVTPSGNRFRCSVDEERAVVEAGFEIVSLITLVQGS